MGNAMTKHRSTGALLGGICALTLAAAATPASAGLTTYLSRTGSGSMCTLAAPCADISAAISAAGFAGEVICLDRFNYGSLVTITQTVTISCGDGLWEAPAGTITISTPAGSDVVIEGLVTDGNGSGGNIITMNGQGALHLRRVRVGNVGGIHPSHGLNFAPNGSATLHMIESVFYNLTGSAVLIKPQSGGSANVHMRNVRFEHNVQGLFADGTNGTINVNMAESAAVENQQNGIGAFSPGSASVTVSVTTSQITGNLTNGIGALATGAGSVAVKIGNSQITGNVNGLATGGSGQILTLGGNQLHSNLSAGAFTGNIPTQ
jgi:hypothetical protein